MSGLFKSFRSVRMDVGWFISCGEKDICRSTGEPWGAETCYRRPAHLSSRRRRIYFKRDICLEGHFNLLRTCDFGLWTPLLCYRSCHLNVPITRMLVILPFIGWSTVNFCLTSSTSELQISI